jgi:hypothetical protein
VAWAGQFRVEKAGTLNALRFITKNILAVVPEESSTIDWLNHYMTMPLATPVQVRAGDIIDVSFSYRCGGSLPSLQATMRAGLMVDAAQAASAGRSPVFA